MSIFLTGMTTSEIRVFRQRNWFDTDRAGNEAFKISDDPIAGSVEVLVNGLDEPTDTFSVRGRTVALLFKIEPGDSVTIKYRYKR